MITLEQENLNLEDLINSKKEIEEKIELDTKVKEEENTIYPLFKNYPNGTEDYYLKLKSIKFQDWKNELRILFIDSSVFGDKYYKLLKSLSCKVSKNTNYYNLIISNDPQKTSAVMSDAPVIYINCRPSKYTNNKIKLFFYDNPKYFKNNEFYFLANNVPCVYREKTVEFIEAIAKLKDFL